MDISEVLKNLTALDGASGNEAPAVQATIKYLEKYGKVHIDTLGSLVLETEGEGVPILLDAHIDQVGMIVTDITDDGFLRVAACGGIDNRTLCAQQVKVLGVKPVVGVVTSIPPHLQQSGEDRKALKTDEAIIDIGMDKRSAEAVVSLGDRIVFDTEFLNLGGDRVASRSLDDRAGMAALIYALEILKNKGCTRKIITVFSTREETTESGAAAAAYAAGAQEFIAVDVSFAHTPDSKKEECGILGAGPMIGVAPSLSQSISDKLKSLAIESQIPYQLEIMNGKTGTNADVMSVARAGMKAGLISIPLRYMHTGIEVVSTNDVEYTGALIAQYISDGGETDA